MTQPILTTRLVSLDVFRGITIVLMVLVNSPGLPTTYAWLEHSVWDGCTLADLVFPFFIVIVGISSTLALTYSKSNGATLYHLFKKTIKRSLFLFFLGLLINAFPHPFDIEHLRILGVLQRIAICYFFSSLCFLTTSKWVQTMIIIVLLIGYWLIVTGFSIQLPLGVSDNIVGRLDRLLLSPQHLYQPMFDPEGLLSTLPAIASALFGNLLGYTVMSSQTHQQQCRWMFVYGLLLLALGWGWSLIFPLNKALWSSSYVLWTSGLAFMVYALCFELIEIKHWVKWSKPFALFGQNALLIYVLHVIFLKIQGVIILQSEKGEQLNLRRYITNTLFHDFTSWNASLCYAICYTLFWLIFLVFLGKLKMEWQQFQDIKKS
ncbi:MAG: heparan-alpha-glucosaminide N-acetyltransferase domain-containing protein [Legionellales bacterium]|nr:heparan-alpha-glucosaminide N-acetyltransferase domain-containing protein [Legionellales bacterium]